MSSAAGCSRSRNTELAALTDTSFQIAVIKGDGIGVDVADAALAVVESARSRVGVFT